MFFLKRNRKNNQPHQSVAKKQLTSRKATEMDRHQKTNRSPQSANEQALAQFQTSTMANIYEWRLVHTPLERDALEALIDSLEEQGIREPEHSIANL